MLFFNQLIYEDKQELRWLNPFCLGMKSICRLLIIKLKLDMDLNKRGRN